MLIESPISARNSMNTIIEAGDANYVYEQVWKHKCKVNFICNINIKDELYQHIHKDQITQIIISEF